MTVFEFETLGDAQYFCWDRGSIFFVTIEYRFEINGQHNRRNFVITKVDGLVWPIIF